MDEKAKIARDKAQAYNVAMQQVLAELIARRKTSKEDALKLVPSTVEFPENLLGHLVADRKIRQRTCLPDRAIYYIVNPSYTHIEEEKMYQASFL